jgi:hypothetical protein
MNLGQQAPQTRHRGKGRRPFTGIPEAANAQLPGTRCMHVAISRGKQPDGGVESPFLLIDDGDDDGDGDVWCRYPDLESRVSVTLVEASAHVLGTFDTKLVEYVSKVFKERNVGDSTLVDSSARAGL